MTRKVCALLLALCSVPAFATTFSANLKTYVNGVPTAFLRLSLTGCAANGMNYIPSVTGSGVYVGDDRGAVDIFPDVTGSISGIEVQDQATITCGNVQGTATSSSPIYYHIEIWSGSQTRPFARYKLREGDYDIYGATFPMNSAAFKNVIPPVQFGGNATSIVGVPVATSPAVQDGQAFVYDVALGKLTPKTPGSGGHTIQSAGTSLIQRSKLNFHGSGVTVTDIPGGDQSDVSINTGAVSFPLLAPDGSFGAPVFGFANEAGLGWYRPSLGIMALPAGKLLRFGAAVSSNASAGMTGIFFGLGQSDAIYAEFPTSDQVCGSVLCVRLIRKRAGTGEVELGDHYGSYSPGVHTAPNFVSTVAVGTQPYAATSTTKNTNLNADMTDGVHVNALTPGTCLRALDATHIASAPSDCGTGGGGASLSTANTWTKTQTFQPDTDVPAVIFQQSNVATPVSDIAVIKDKSGNILARIQKDGSLKVGNSAATLNLGATGVPTGSCNNGSMYTRSDGGTGTTFYVCEAAAWVAK